MQGVDFTTAQTCVHGQQIKQLARCRQQSLARSWSRVMSRNFCSATCLSETPRETSRGFVSPFNFNRARQIRLEARLPLRCRLGR
jgi:hypothetical protein